MHYVMHCVMLLPRQIKLLYASVVLSMFLTPFLNDLGALIASKLKNTKVSTPKALVLLCCGRVVRP